MPRRRATPPHPVFRGSTSGLTRAELRAGLAEGLWRRLFRDVYTWAGLQDDVLALSRGLALVLPPDAVIAGATAAWLLGVEPLDSEDHAPTALVSAAATVVPERAGAVLRKAPLPDGDVVDLHGLRVTSPARTVLDLARLGDLTEAVVVADALLHVGRLTVAELQARVEQMRGWRGVCQAREAVRDAEPLAESPMESRLRMLLVLAGLPRPVAQFVVYDGTRPVARCDLAYPEARLLLEFDGREIHAGKAFDGDRARQNRLVTALGYRLLRYTGPAVLGRSPVVVAEVREALAGTPRPAAAADQGVEVATRRRVTAPTP